MLSLSKEIFETYQARRTKEQKQRFIDLLKQHYPDMTVEEEKGLLPSRNLVIGNIENAKMLFTAHYDTCSRLPVPNFIAPKRVLLSLGYSMLLALPFLLLMMVAEMALLILTDNFNLSYVASILVFVASYFGVFMFGPANTTTANDNTSGVISVLELMAAMSDEQRSRCAFVLFDNEENGLVGSSAFRKRHKKQMKDKLLVNLDCVSDGDNIMIAMPTKLYKNNSELFRSCFEGDDSKTLYIEKLERLIYPSDQNGFKHGVAVCALKKAKIIGLYMNRIHTKRDTAFDESNIEYIVNGLVKLCDCDVTLK